MACIIFTAPSPRDGEFFCRPPSTVLNANTAEKFQNLLDVNKTQWIRLTHPEIDESRKIPGFEDKVIDFCNVYADSHQVAEHYFHKMTSLTHRYLSPPQRNLSEVVPCEEFFHHSDYESLITEFNLVCGKDILVATTQSCHLFGKYCDLQRC